jgi:hypothetical protein
MNSKTTLTVFAIVAAFAVVGLMTPGLQTAEAKKPVKTSSVTDGGGGGLEIEIRDSNLCVEDCNQLNIGGSGNDEIEDFEINFD